MFIVQAQIFLAFSIIEYCTIDENNIINRDGKVNLKCILDTEKCILGCVYIELYSILFAIPYTFINPFT